jgi:hypothetical protein
MERFDIMASLKEWKTVTRLKYTFHSGKELGKEEQKSQQEPRKSLPGPVDGVQIQHLSVPGSGESDPVSMIMAEPVADEADGSHAKSLRIPHRVSPFVHITCPGDHSSRPEYMFSPESSRLRLTVSCTQAPFEWGKHAASRYFASGTDAFRLHNRLGA